MISDYVFLISCYLLFCFIIWKASVWFIRSNEIKLNAIKAFIKDDKLDIFGLIYGIYLFGVLGTLVLMGISTFFVLFLFFLLKGF